MTEALYCNADAISAQDRSRYRELTDRMMHASQSAAELRDGYALQLDPSITLPEIGEWLAFERTCCPFLHFTLELRDGLTILNLQIPNHPHAKPFLRAEFRLP